MKINDYRAAQIAQSYGLQNVVDGSAGKPKKAAPRADEASLSPEARELLKARRAVQGAPDVRAALVAQLRQQVQAGTYRVDERSLARRLLQHLDFSDA